MMFLTRNLVVSHQTYQLSKDKDGDSKEISCIRQCLRIIDRLVDQQAMPDDSYLEDLEGILVKLMDLERRDKVQ